jgi:hypothetical protein
MARITQDLFSLANFRDETKNAGLKPRRLFSETSIAVQPADAFIRLVADAFKIESESLFLLAGRVPANWKKAIS